MKILVTGSNGLLGQKLTDYYRNIREVTLIATAKGADRYPQQLGYVYESMDICNASQVNEILTKYKPDALINTAAMTNVDSCETDKTGCDSLNVEAVANLVNACNQNHTHLIHVSTDFIFDGTHGPLKEDETPNPLSYYGHSKLKAEQIVIQQSNSWAILRTVLVYGVVNDMSRSNIVLWAKTNLEQKKPIHVVADQFRTPTLAEDLAQACALAASNKAQGIYHISGPEFMSVFDIVYQVAEFWNLDKSLINMSDSKGLNQPAKRPPITGFNIEKAIKQLGYKPHCFKEGLTLLHSQLQNIIN